MAVVARLLGVRLRGLPLARTGICRVPLRRQPPIDHREIGSEAYSGRPPTLKKEQGILAPTLESASATDMLSPQTTCCL